MTRKFWIIVLAMAVTPVSVLAQSQLSRQIQQKLNQRKSTKEVAEKKASTNSDDDAPTSNPQVATASFQPKSPKEFAQSMHLAVLSGNIDAYNKLVSWQSILNRATAKLDGKPIDEFRKSFMSDIKSRRSLGVKIISTVNSGGSYEFLQVRKNSNTVVAVFRMLLPGGKGVNYHEYALAKTKQNLVVASDVYVYLNGEELSQSIRRNLISAMGDPEKSGVKMSGNDQLLAENISVIDELNQALSKNDANEARAQILKLPGELRNDKAIQTMTLNVYRNSKAFAKVLGGVRQTFPEDVFMDMIAIDILVRQKQYQEAIVSIERINKKVGGDPFLKILHGRMLLNLGKSKDGREMIQEAVAQDAGILSGHWNLVSFSLKDQNHGKTLELLKTIHQRFRINFKDLRKIPSYKHFVKSAEFSQWTEYLKTAAVSAPDTTSSETTSSESTAPESDDLSSQTPKDKKRTASKTGSRPRK